MVGALAFQLCHKIGITRKALQRWSKETVAFLPQKIRMLQQQLSDLKNLSSTEVSEVTLTDTQFLLQAIMKKEEDLWRSKSRIQWLTTKNLNTRFFHLSTIIRRDQNYVNILQDSAGLWHSDR